MPTLVSERNVSELYFISVTAVLLLFIAINEQVEQYSDPKMFTAILLYELLKGFSEA